MSQFVMSKFATQADMYAAMKARIAELEAENRVLVVKTTNSLANNLCPDHRDKQTGKPCLACTIEALEKNAVRLYNGLVRARQNLFPHIDQEEVMAVMARDFPLIAALKS
ncbi:MAG: hypothetical protein PHW66_09435 [Gallionella sp.]|nr:hypothetical protein [Gallionella sp.]